jgi:hypothetical protein
MKRGWVLPGVVVVASLICVAVATGTGGRSSVEAKQRRPSALLRALDGKRGARTSVTTRRRRHGVARRGQGVGRQGPAGPPGPQGAPGPPGAFRTTNITTAEGSVAKLCPSSGDRNCISGISEARCPSGTKAVGGGWTGDNGQGPLNATVSSNGPDGLDEGWVVAMINNSSAETDFHARAVCAG